MNTTLKVLAAAVAGLAAGFGAARMFIPEASISHTEGADMQASMDAMTGSLSGKTGAEFDRTFLAEMIMHHEGAVAMAQLALQNAGHAELKTMANAIISAQTDEINQMKAWNEAWFADHSAH